MKDFVLINLPVPFLQHPMAMPPLGLLYIAAAVERAGFDVAVCDLALGFDAADVPAARVYGLSATTPLSVNVSAAVKLCRAANPDAHIVLGGPHATAEGWAGCEQYGVDSVVRGEGEIVAPRLVANIVMGLDVEREILGESCHALDALPFPAWHMLNMQNYGQAMNGYQTCTVSGARGCPFNCAFCSKEVFGKVLRRRSTENILAEVETLKSRYRYRAIHFLDDVLLMSEKDIIDLCFGMRELDMKWKCLMRVDRVDKMRLGLMARCGCQEIAYGIESGSQEILDGIDKGTTVKQNEDAVRWTQNAGMKAKAFIVIGLPGESHKTVAETKRWFEKARPQNFTVTTLRPFKGSPLHDRPEEYGIRILDQSPENYSYRGKGSLTSVVETEHLSAAEIADLANDLDAYFESLLKSGL